MSVAANPTGFSTSLLKCCDDCGICCTTCFCPCYQIAKNKAGVDGRRCTCCDCMCAYPNLEFFTRVQLRSKYNIPLAHCADCLTLMYCYSCMVCQDAREINIRAK